MCRVLCLYSTNICLINGVQEVLSGDNPLRLRKLLYVNTLWRKGKTRSVLLNDLHDLKMDLFPNFQVLCPVGRFGKGVDEDIQRRVSKRVKIDHEGIFLARKIPSWSILTLLETLRWISSSTPLPKRPTGQSTWKFGKRSILRSWRSLRRTDLVLPFLHKVFT